jgi:hypothetical protein
MRKNLPTFVTGATTVIRTSMAVARQIHGITSITEILRGHPIHVPLTTLITGRFAVSVATSTHQDITGIVITLTYV